MKKLLTKDGEFLRWPASINTLAKASGACVSRSPELPYTCMGTDGAIYTLLEPVAVDQPTGFDIVYEIAPVKELSDWVQRWATADFTPEEFEEYKAGARTRLLNVQNQHADAGTVTPDQSLLQTDAAAVAEITGAIDGTRREPGKQRKVNIQAGCTVADEAELQAMMDAMDVHRQACHDRGFDLDGQLAACNTKEEVDAIMNNDLYTGWPA